MPDWMNLQCNRQTMPTLLAQHTVDTPASPKAAWALWTEPSRWRNFYPGLDRAEGTLKVGAPLTLRGLHAGGEQSFKVLAFEPGVTFTLQRRLLFADLTLVHRVDPSALGCRLHVKAQLSGPLGWLQGRLRRRAWDAFLPMLLRRLAQEAQVQA